MHVLQSLPVFQSAWLRLHCPCTLLLKLCIHVCCCAVRCSVLQVIHHDRDTAQAVASEVQLMLHLNHPNIVRAYHCITRQMRTSQAGAADTAASQQHGWGSAAAATAVVGASGPTPAAPSSAPGSIGGPGSSSGLHTPSAAAPAAAGRFPSWNPQLKQLQRQQLQQQQQPADAAALPGQGGAASYVPFVGIRPASSSSSQTLDRPSALRSTSASTAASGVSTATLTPATPGEVGLHGPHPAPAASLSLPTTTTTGSTQPGVLSSDGLSLLAQDLDPSVLPVYQRRQSYQQGQQLLSPLNSVASGSAASGGLSAASTALGTTDSMVTATDMPGSLAAVSGLAPAAAGVAAGPSLLLGNPGQGRVSSLSGSARSQLVSSAALPAPGSSGLATGSAVSSGSAGGSSRPWRIMGTTSLSEVQPASESGSDEGPPQLLAGGSGRRSLARRASAAMCETWLVLELCDR